MMIRRTSSLILRAIRSNSTTLIHTIPTSQQRKHSHSSVASAENSVDATLYKVLKHETKSYNYRICGHAKIPDSVPFKIEVEVEDDVRRYRVEDDERRYRSIKLGRELPGGEKITLEIDMNKVNMKESAIPMTVKVYRHGKDGDYIKFNITLSKEDLTVQRFSVFFRGNIDGNSSPKFKEMDTVLQQWLRKYLEIRGIKTNMASDLLKYIAMENQKIDLSVLNIFKNYLLY